MEFKLSEKSKKIGDRIKQLREAHEMSLRGLASLITENGSKVSHVAVSKWESGEAIPKPHHVASMGKIFSVDPGMLMWGKTHPAKREKELAARIAMLPIDAQERLAELIDSMLTLTQPEDPHDDAQAVENRG